jgi:hypothetical protein
MAGRRNVPVVNYQELGQERFPRANNPLGRPGMLGLDQKGVRPMPNELISWDSYGRGLVATGMPNTGEREEKERGDIQPRTGFCRNGYVCPNGEVLGEMKWEVARCL